MKSSKFNYDGLMDEWQNCAKGEIKKQFKIMRQTNFGLKRVNVELFNERISENVK